MRINLKNLDRAPFHDNVAWFKTTETSSYKYFIIIPENNLDKEDYVWLISKNTLNSDMLNTWIYKLIKEKNKIKKWTKKEYDSLNFDTYQKAREQILKRLIKKCGFIKMKQKKFEKLTDVKIFKELQLEERYHAELLI
jgi:hypothetical protein